MLGFYFFLVLIISSFSLEVSYISVRRLQKRCWSKLICKTYSISLWCYVCLSHDRLTIKCVVSLPPPPESLSHCTLHNSSILKTKSFWNRRCINHKQHYNSSGLFIIECNTLCILFLYSVTLSVYDSNSMLPECVIFIPFPLLFFGEIDECSTLL